MLYAAYPPLRDSLFTVPFLLTFGLLLLVFDPAQRIARLFGRWPQEYVAGALQWSLVKAFGVCGTRLEVERSPSLRPHTPYIIIANHQSMFDIPIFGALLFTNFPKYVSKRSLARWIPSISYNLRRGGNAIINRGDSEQARGAIRQLAAESGAQLIAPTVVLANAASDNSNSKTCPACSPPANGSKSPRS